MRNATMTVPTEARTKGGRARRARDGVHRTATADRCDDGAGQERTGGDEQGKGRETGKRLHSACLPKKSAPRSCPRQRSAGKSRGSRTTICADARASLNHSRRRRADFFLPPMVADLGRGFGEALRAGRAAGGDPQDVEAVLGRHDGADLAKLQREERVVERSRMDAAHEEAEAAAHLARAVVLGKVPRGRREVRPGVTTC